MAATAYYDRIIDSNIYKYNRPSARSAKKRRILLAAAGIFIGIVNGIFGAGGGMLAVPALSFIGGLDDRRSHATAIAVILPLCIVSTIVYSLRSAFDWNVILPTVIGVVAGGVVGALLLKKLSNDILSFLFYGLMLFAGLKMIVG
ncbi:MAG: sulfite exporter TauE/SafE family protein [Clostridia bacterium]|nr:sulfite exporter TauE/SafE family protein [Clostridia bacterium]